MKKLCMCIGLALVLMLSVTAGSHAAGLCMDVSSSCNDYYVEFVPLGTGGVYLLHGYEYGCSLSDRLGSGTMRVVGDQIYYSIAISSMSSGAGDTGGGGGHWSGMVNLSSLTGSTAYDFYYITGGAINGHGGTESVSISLCPPQDVAPLVNETDAMLK